MRIRLLAAFWLIAAAAGVFAQPNDSCRQSGALELSAAQTRSQLLDTSPLSTPLPNHSTRITNAILTFEIGIDIDGKVSCVQAVSGHPIFMSAALRSIKTWKFRPITGQSQRPRAVSGALVLRVSETKDGLDLNILSAAPLTGR